MYDNIIFHRDGSVSKEGYELGTWRKTAVLWMFKAWDGKTESAQSRRGLNHFALMAYLRAREARRNNWLRDKLLDKLQASMSRE